MSMSTQRTKHVFAVTALGGVLMVGAAFSVAKAPSAAAPAHASSYLSYLSSHSQRSDRGCDEVWGDGGCDTPDGQGGPVGGSDHGDGDDGY